MSLQPLVDSQYLLKKFPGKGGWTYAEIPEIHQNKNNPFGWVKVRGNIDGYELKQYKLMPMGNGRLFLPVKSAIRKKIKKEQGDSVHIVLFADDSEVEIPEEILNCFATEPKELLQNFLSFSDGEKKAYLDWIYAAKKDETKVNRIVTMMERVQKRLRLHDEEH